MSAKSSAKQVSPDYESASLSSHQKEQYSSHQGRSSYRHLLIMTLVHLPLMYAIMFTMVYSISEVVHNLNTFYMAGMMAAPMIVLMPLMMGRMYPNKKLNLAVYAGSVLIFFGLFAFMRNQTFIGDKQFLRSMIPHHSGAILMCERAKLQDSRILDLCQKIIEGQKAEIAQMQELLGTLQ